MRRSFNTEWPCTTSIIRGVYCALREREEGTRTENSPLSRCVTAPDHEFVEPLYHRSRPESWSQTLSNGLVYHFYSDVFHFAGKPRPSEDEAASRVLSMLYLFPCP